MTVGCSAAVSRQMLHNGEHAAGLKPFNHGDYDPGRRFYFLDPDGIEYEIISYR